MIKREDLDKKVAEANLPRLPEIQCEQCKTIDPSAFKNAYYIPPGGNLPEGWVLWCQECQDMFMKALVIHQKKEKNEQSNERS